MTKGLISIIIPIYNTEKYLSHCLDSIISQTYTNWEAILVDDGSLDKCGVICDEYAAKDNRFKVIHQKNGGVSVARQAGLENAIGEYIIHCDPDDWVDPTMLEEMLECAVTNNADMVICDLLIEKEQVTTYSKQDITDNTTAKGVISKIINEQVHGSLCNKLLRRECCNGINFVPKEIHLAEDELFNIRVLLKDICVTYLPKAFYHYRMYNNLSICHSKDSKVIKSRIKTVKEYEKILDKNEYDDFFIIKKDILLTLFITGNIEDIDIIFPEINQRIINYKRKYNPLTPLGYFFAKCLKGNKYKAYYLYKIHISIINFVKKLKNKLRLK